MSVPVPQPDAAPRPTPPTPPAADNASRTLYALALDPEAVFPGAGFTERLRAEVRGLPAPETEGAGLTELRDGVAAWSARERDRCLALLGECDAPDAVPGTAAVLAERAALACAPLAVVAGAWLQWLSGPGTAEDSDALSVLALYASDVGVGQPNASRGSAYVALLQEAELAGYAVPTSRLTLDQRIADREFYLPAVLLAMSRHPEEFRPEILGADACLRVAGLLPALVVAAGGADGAGRWAERLRSEPPAPGWDPVWASLLAQEEKTGERVATGFRWAWAGLERWHEDVYADLCAARDPAFTMAELISRRAREGAVYHHRYELDGRPLNELLREARHDPAPLLDALAASKLVRPGRSGASPLVNGLVMERGPMFRVFSPEDLSVIRRWIDSLPAGTSAVAPPPGAGRPVSHPLPALLRSGPAPGPTGTNPTPTDVRSAYHLLQRRQDTPELRRYAYDYASAWLARARHGLDKSPDQLPTPWTPQGLRPWLLDQHDRHDQAFADGDNEPASREELIDSTVQLAPLTLIDGAWLQGFTDYEHAAAEHGSFLFETYYDELGNGVHDLSHPVVYRKLLAQMDVHLPPTDSPEFANWPGFRASSLELPVYWLSIGRLPQTFMPEIFGLNLAMELSGVGGSYRRASIDLRHHGFSTRFVDLHNTIDNVATGHSAWAADAIDAYMSAIVLAQGVEAQTAVWERIRAGYRSLNPPSSFWARQAARRARRSDRGRRPAVHAPVHREERAAQS
ncbi:iron-containing redox enzyme family protein [Streptomyces sp. NPDC059894]|uniref:iron-containing redox enzyme family protein n=1 Tax=unclassified Streptomyces TaxID=2593676 RepID=UPI003650FFC2